MSDEYETEQYYLEPQEVYCRITHCCQCGHDEISEDVYEEIFFCPECKSEDLEVEFDWVE